jgi:hypothetical protein
MRRWRRFAAFAWVLYAFFLVTTQFEHHDFACHLKTPQHCTACNASQLGETPAPSVALAAHFFADAGDAILAPCLAEGALLAASCSGRSPPSRL